jgi:hypothetical protein
LMAKASEAQRKGAGSAVLQIRRLSRIDKLHVVDGRIIGFDVAELESSPTIDLGEPAVVKRRYYEPVSGDVVVAIPPKAFGRLIDSRVHAADPDLININRLQGMPLAAFDVYFKRKLGNVPKGVVLLLDSLHELSFLDTSQLWPRPHGDDATSLNVILSDYQLFSGWNERDIASLKKYILDDLKLYVEFKDEDVDHDRSHFQTNSAEELFINEVGSWEFRPETTCEIQNLFIAGDYCKTPIDVVTVEGAVVSGLMAAEAIRRQERIGESISILQPRSCSEAAMAGVAGLAAPLAYAAKIASTVYDTFKSSYDESFPNG